MVTGAACSPGIVVRQEAGADTDTGSQLATRSISAVGAAEVEWSR